MDDCIALAARECATEHELRAALCVAVGQALHARYEARGYSDAAETAKRDADRARAEARAYGEALTARDSAPDTSDGIDYPARAEVWRLREALDACREERDRCGALIVAAREERDRAVRERDEARAHPTYEARTVAPTPEECAAHDAHGGIWYITGGTTMSCVVSSTAADAPPWAAHWLPLDRDGLPCAWPVPGEVTL